MALSEEQKVVSVEASGNVEVISAFRRIPYNLISKELGEYTDEFLADLGNIMKFYNIYRNGADFYAEGSNGDYVPSDLHYKMAASLIDKEARFLFSETPTISVTRKDSNAKLTEDISDNLDLMNELVQSVLYENNFSQAILRAAKDCFIGKRVAALVNFNEDDGITVTFLPSTNFLYEYDMGMRRLLKFIAYVVVKDSSKLSDRILFEKKYTVEDSGVMLEENLYTGTGTLVENVTSRQPVLLDEIPAVVILNDGLLGDIDGESEIENLAEYEKMYSKLSNADIDSERKSMNSIKYTVDMDSKSTKDLSTAPGAYWDLGSDQSLDNPKTMVGSLESSMSYSGPLQTTLDRIKTTGYEQVDMPNITLQSMQGAITSGKALKAVYWPLIIRCKEKMKTWAPHLAKMVKFIIDGSILYPRCAQRYIQQLPFEMQYEVDVEQNTPLPEDETEEKSIDISEVAAFLMSKKSYMKKWRGLSDEEVEDELMQIAYEKNMIDESAMFPPSSSPSTSSVSGREPGLLYSNQGGIGVSTGGGEEFKGNVDDPSDTTGGDSSRSLGDNHHMFA